MNLDRFVALVDAYGADARRWPPPDRAAAVAFAADNAAAAAVLHEAAVLDALLDADVAAPASTSARLAVMAALPAPPQDIARRWRELLALLGGWRIAAPAMAMSLVAGINLGAATGLTTLGGGTTVSDDVGIEILSRQGFAETLFLGLNPDPQ